ncbi:MAG: SDR family oxidoreductase [Paenibacillus sp.]|nr:SDR family oxidoreductase [Paenibacillus sp.]
MNAFGRFGETEDIAAVILFLASEESQWVTGQTLRANGGFI